MSKSRTLWLVLSGVVAACPSFFCCLMGFTTLAGATTYETEFGGATSSGTMNPAMGLVFLCLGLLPWLLPAGVWLYTRKKSGAGMPASSSDAFFTPKPGQPYSSPWEDE